MRSIQEIEEGFRTFAFKIQRLYQFGVELDSLNTQGFESEVQSIRAKLKQPRMVAQVAQEMDSLKQRIQARETPITGKRASNTVTAISGVNTPRGLGILRFIFLLTAKYTPWYHG